MDELMNMDLFPDHIAAAHVCSCNPRGYAHYPADWLVRKLFFLRWSKKNNTFQDSSALCIHCRPESRIPASCNNQEFTSPLFSTQLWHCCSQSFVNTSPRNRRVFEDISQGLRMEIPRPGSIVRLFQRKMEAPPMVLQRPQITADRSSQFMVYSTNSLPSLHIFRQTVAVARDASWK
jgi:hypothetical protein